MNARHTKEQEKYRFHMFYTDIFFLILTFVSYNYHFEGQNYNLSEFGRYVSQSQVVRSPLPLRRAVVRSSVRPFAASRKIHAPFQVVAKASGFGRREVDTPPLWRGISPILHQRQQEMCKIHQMGNLLDSVSAQ